MENTRTPPPQSETISSTGFAGLDDVLEQASLETLAAAETCLCIHQVLMSSDASDIKSILDSLHTRIIVRSRDAQMDDLQRAKAWLDLIPNMTTD